MKRPFLIFSFMLLSLNIVAQTTKINIGLEFREDHISGESYLANSNSFSGSSILRNDFNYTFGLVSTFKTGSNVGLKTGILYSNKDYRQSFYCINCLSIVAEPMELKQRFISIPLLISIKNDSKRLKPYFEAGLVHNYGVSKNNSINKPSFLEGQLGIGLSYGLIENLDIEISYQVRSALSAIFENNVGPSSNEKDYDLNKLRTNSFGIGLSYKL